MTLSSRSENEPREISRRECPQCGESGKGCECAYNGGFTEVWYVDKAAYLNARAERDITLERLEAAEGDRAEAIRMRDYWHKRWYDSCIALGKWATRIADIEGERDRLRDCKSLAQWLVAMDEPDSSQRRTVTLTEIIEAARAALSTGDRQDDDSHVRTAEATQPAQARPDSGGGSPTTFTPCDPLSGGPDGG